MKLASVLLIALFVSASVSAQTPESVDWSKFKSDGCTWWPDKDFADCCVEHDRAYFKGGSQKDRRRADDRLYKCVLSKDRSRNKRDAQLMWLGVRVGGIAWLPTPFRWGYGTNYWKANSEWLRRSSEGINKGYK